MCLNMDDILEKVEVFIVDIAVYHPQSANLRGFWEGGNQLRKAFDESKTTGFGRVWPESTKHQWNDVSGEQILQHFFIQICPRYVGDELMETVGSHRFQRKFAGLKWMMMDKILGLSNREDTVSMRMRKDLQQFYRDIVICLIEKR